MNKIIKASGNEVEPYWPGLFAKALEGQDIAALLTNVGSGPAAGAAPAGGADAGAAPAEEKKKEKRLLYPLGLNGKYATSHSHNILKVSPTEYCMPLLLLHFKNRFSLSTIFQSIIFHEISIALDLTTLWTD